MGALSELDFRVICLKICVEMIWLSLYLSQPKILNFYREELHRVSNQVFVHVFVHVNAHHAHRC